MIADCTRTPRLSPPEADDGGQGLQIEVYGFLAERFRAFRSEICILKSKIAEFTTLRG